MNREFNSFMILNNVKGTSTCPITLSYWETLPNIDPENKVFQIPHNFENT